MLKLSLTQSFDAVMLLLSALLTILGVLPRLLGELDSVNAMISTETESLQKESKYECPCPEDSSCQSKRQETSHHQPRHPAVQRVACGPCRHADCDRRHQRRHRPGRQRHDQHPL